MSMKEIEKLIKKTEVEINKIPSGELRNLLCDLNIVIQLYNKKVPTIEEIQEQAKTYDNLMTSIAEGIWMPKGFEAGATWVCNKFLLK